MSNDLMASVHLRQIEAERNFAAAAFLRYDQALEQCGWLDPKIFADEQVRKFWEGLKAHGDNAKAAMEAGIFTKVASSEWMGQEVYYGMGIAAYAEAVTTQSWFYSVGSRLSELASAIGKSDLEEARRALEAMSAEAPQTFQHLPDAADIGIGFIASLDEENTTVKSGIPKVDIAWGGFWKANFYVVCARPGVGKTAFLLQCARNAARAKHVVLFQSLEMSARDLWARMTCGAAEISYRDVMAKRINDTQKQKLIDQANDLIELYNDYLIIDDSANGTTETLWQNVATYRPDIVFTDHLRLENDRKELQEDKRLGVISWNHKRIAKEFNIPVLAAAQLNRNLEHRQDKEPELSDLRDSGQIEENADVVIGIHRDRADVQQEVQTRLSPALLKGLKFRNGPGSIRANMMFDGLAQWFCSPE